jgi:uncharacterized protein (DUF362 family)
MLLDVTLQQGNLTQDLHDTLVRYYQPLDIEGDYAERLFKKWADDDNIVVYRAAKKSEPIGWIVYNPHKSLVEQILVNQNQVGKGMEAPMLDALVAKESLVAAEILSSDEDAYGLLVEYGFRPTRSYTSDGFDLVKLDLSTAVYLKKTTGQNPSEEYRKTETVVVEKIPSTRSHIEIKTAIMRILDSLGGLETFVKIGQTVVIKPNVVADHGMKDGVYMGGIVTDLGLLKALVEILLPVAGKIIIAEGSSINRAETTKLFELYGYNTLVDLHPSKVSLVDLHQDKLVKKTVPRGKRMLSRDIPVTFENADTIINVPVMKIHFAAIASLSIKNLQGALPPLEKYMSHYFGLWQNLVNIHHLVKPNLIIIDGLTAQENFGPVNGSPKTMNLLIGGTNAVATDAVTMRIMGLDPALSPPVRVAHMQAMGPIEPERIQVRGASIDEVRSPFRQPEINLEGGENLVVHAGSACPGCRGYLHYVLYKLRRPDPQHPGKLLIDRPFEKKVNLYLGPVTDTEPNPNETNIFLGTCQQHRKDMGKHLPGCPPHTDVMMKGVFSLYPDVVLPQYADQTAEDKLEAMLKEVLKGESS